MIDQLAGLQNIYTMGIRNKKRQKSSNKAENGESESDEDSHDQTLQQKSKTNSMWNNSKPYAEMSIRQGLGVRFGQLMEVPIDAVLEGSGFGKEIVDGIKEVVYARVVEYIDRY